MSKSGSSSIVLCVSGGFYKAAALHSTRGGCTGVFGAPLSLPFKLVAPQPAIGPRYDGFFFPHRTHSGYFLRPHTVFRVPGLLQSRAARVSRGAGSFQLKTPPSRVLAGAPILGFVGFKGSSKKKKLVVRRRPAPSRRLFRLRRLRRGL